MMESLRILLFPFSLLYDAITKVRNWAFDKGYIEQTSFNLPVIAVGNLSTGGTGKTPMIEWLIEHYKDQQVGVLSRGYGRVTTGFITVEMSSTASEVGDEPLQIKHKFKNSIVSAVCEKRVVGINKLLEQHELDVLLLDDAFQHRYVKASHYILLTSYARPYYNDYLLPAGDLRESKDGSARAQTIIVTKCPDNLPQMEQKKIIENINPLPHQQVCFARIAYDSTVHNDHSHLNLDDLKGEKITLVTGIAKPEPLLSFLKKYVDFEHLEYGDHHRFRESEIKEIASKELVITTEKDYMRLMTHELKNVYYIAMKMEFIGDTPVL